MKGVSHSEITAKLRFCAQHFSCDGCPGECYVSSKEPRTAFVLNDAADAIEELLAAVPHWISVEDALPEKEVNVLCACRANIFCVMKWDGIDWYENPTHVYMSGFVTHWMPLPEPPKEDAE